MMDRQLFLGAGIAGASALTFSSLWSQSRPSFGPPVLPEVGFRRRKLSAMEIIALDDGGLRRPLGEEFVSNAPLEHVKALLASQNLPNHYVDISFTAFLLVSGNTEFLIDTGFADNGPPTTGKLRANLAAAGYKPKDIDHIIIGHDRGDHIHSLAAKDGSMVYPNAKVHVPAPAPERAYWMDDTRMEAAPPAMKGAFQAARRTVGSLPAGQLVVLEPGAEMRLASRRQRLTATHRA